LFGTRQVTEIPEQLTKENDVSFRLPGVLPYTFVHFDSIENYFLLGGLGK